jgi:predicted PurR-regulated permease PerM
LYLAGLGIYTETMLMTDDLPAYASRINELVSGASTRLEQYENSISKALMPRRLQDTQPLPATTPGSAAQGKRGKTVPPETPTFMVPPQEVRVLPEQRQILSYAYDYFRGFYDVLLMASFVPFLVYFWLAWGDHMRSRLLSSFEGETRYTAEKVMDGVGSMVRAYAIGNFLLGIFLTIASGVFFAALELPYWLVVAPVSGFLSLVPYIGMPLALIPPLVAALPAKSDPTTYVFIALTVALLHLFALNLLYPKFVGSRVHLNPLVATVALMFWGMMWGAIGLVLAIPITAAIRAVCENVDEWKPYGRLLGD